MPRARRAVLVLVAGYAIVIGAFCALGLQTENAFPASGRNGDLTWTQEASSWVAQRDWLRSILEAVTHAGGGGVTIPIAVAAGIAWLWRRRDWRAPAVLALSIAGSTGAKSAVKTLVDRPRPPIARLVETTGSSFPSGHAVRAVALYGALAFLATLLLRARWMRAVAWSTAVLLSAVVATSRVALGVHYVTDAIAGMLLGAAWLAIVGVALSQTHEGTGQTTTKRR